MAWFLYLIECTDGSIYTGIAVDVAARYAKHMSGTGARYTRSHKPLQLLASFEMPDRATASRAEYRVKRLSPGAKRALAEGAADVAGALLYAFSAEDPGMPALAGP